MPATFFVIGEWARRDSRLVRAEAGHGDEVGDHTETHPFVALLAPVQRAEIVDAGEAIHAAGAPFPHLWRPPYRSFGGRDPDDPARAENAGRALDTRDYARPGAGRIAYVAISGARPGAIILIHHGGGTAPRRSRRCRASSPHCASAASGW
jgi:chitooligosaccharide deacetylase